MPRVTEMLAIAIAIAISFYAVDAARIAPTVRSSKAVAFINHNITSGGGRNLPSHFQTLYSDGEGTYVDSDSVDSNDDDYGVKCWTDYFAVRQYPALGNWVKASGNVYCTGTSSCHVDHMDGHQTCQTWSIELSAGIKTEIIDLGFKGGYETQDCNSGQDTTSCAWSDGQCHCIWTQQQLLRQEGYKRRRCAYDYGDVTKWTQDWVHDMPTKFVNYGCGSKCTDT